MGVFAREWVEPLAQVQKRLGADKVWVVHGSDGMDELTTTGPSHVAELSNGEVRTFEVSPADAGLDTANPADLLGGAPEENARALKAVLEGEKGAFRDIVVLNTAAGLIVADRASSLAEGADMARAALDDGRALATLEKLAAITNGKG